MITSGRPVVFEDCSGFLHGKLYYETFRDHRDGCVEQVLPVTGDFVVYATDMERVDLGRNMAACLPPARLGDFRERGTTARNTARSQPGRSAARPKMTQ